MSTPSPWKYFTLEELSCRCGCGLMNMRPHFMRKLVAMREEAGFPFHVTSATRCSEHDEKVGSSSSAGGGPHTTGLAADIAVNGQTGHKLIGLAVKAKLTGMGISVKGGTGFIHLDELISSPRPNIWSY